ncbi:hypothetical protein [Pseudomonas syringae]|uniref:hypothetical protein n=1 Tax=Pseudomonas syringae TaxID=317 RepID=UPI00046384E6|nr:hypothetical protein [Pseudomonas syringae]UOF21412.1 hypothetical protein N023_07865 [Pseudomonas syringae CC440]UZA78986.1 hypothetical protein EZZ79_08225 [Pseudomonas syringae]
MDSDALITVAEDLEYLSTWSGVMPDAEIRRGSAILRRLLVEDAYSHAWRAVGFARQPSLFAVDLKMFVGNDLGKVVLALAGGATYRGFEYALLMINKGTDPVGGEPPADVREGAHPFEQSYDLTRYMNSPSGVVNGDTFTRRDVIKYIANVKGGVHLSPKERKQEAKLIARMEKIEKKFILQAAEGFPGSDALLIELVAIGQSLGLSPDAKVYISQVRKHT